MTSQISQDNIDIFINDMLINGASALDIQNIMNDFLYDASLNMDNISSKNISQNNSNNKIKELWKNAESEILPMLFSCPSIRIKVKINDKEYQALLDTGAEINILNKNVVDECKLNDIVDTNYKAIAQGVGEAKILGCIPYLNISFENYECPCNFSIMEQLQVDMILG